MARAQGSDGGTVLRSSAPVFTVSHPVARCSLADCVIKLKHGANLLSDQALCLN